MATDRRLQKTERALREALLLLLKTKPIDQITTTELCRKAEINRNTFYAHYSSPSALLEKIEDGFIADVLHIINDTLERGDYADLLLRVCHFMRDNRELSSLLLSENGNRNYQSRLIGTMHARVIDLWDNAESVLPRADLELLYYYVTFGAQKCMLLWAEQGFREPPEEIAGKLTRMTETMLSHYMPLAAI